jgi:hypothetical protein|uniref:Uncharacterized protein n=1 Tax=viral metagenome TaxID=1070528 RepID=A0A6C0EW68_9ZZZZ
MYNPEYINYNAIISKECIIKNIQLKYNKMKRYKTYIIYLISS